MKQKILKSIQHELIRFFLSDLSEVKKICCSKGQSTIRKKGKEDIQWIDYNFEILLAYNTKNIHSATGLVPAEARKPKNEAKAKLNMTIKATMTRKYPELEVGSQVKVMRKKLPKKNAVRIGIRKSKQ